MMKLSLGLILSETITPALELGQGGSQSEAAAPLYQKKQWIDWDAFGTSVRIFKDFQTWRRPSGRPRRGCAPRSGAGGSGW